MNRVSWYEFIMWWVGLLRLRRCANCGGIARPFLHEPGEVTRDCTIDRYWHFHYYCDCTYSWREYVKGPKADPNRIGDDDGGRTLTPAA